MPGAYPENRPNFTQESGTGMTQVLLKAGHSSGQATDTEAQQTSDAKKLTARMVHRDWQWLTGTEAGVASVLHTAFGAIDDKNGLKFRKGTSTDVWIMHRKDLFHGEVEAEFHKVVDGVGREFTDRGVFRVTGGSPLFEAELTIMVAHFLTAKSIERTGLTDANERICAKIAELGKQFGKHRNLCFYDGDQNLQDRKVDTFKGAPFTSLADELKKWQNTGHGDIDVMASYNADNRVTGHDFDVFDDTEFPLHSDHFLCEGSWQVRV